MSILSRGTDIPVAFGLILGLQNQLRKKFKLILWIWIFSLLQIFSSHRKIQNTYCQLELSTEIVSPLNQFSLNNNDEWRTPGDEHIDQTCIPQLKGNAYLVSYNYVQDLEIFIIL